RRVGDVLVLEGELVRGWSAGHLGVAVERLAVTGLDAPSAAGPEPVGDGAGDLALARAGRADQAQESRAVGVLHVEQGAGELVDRLAVQAWRVDALAVGQLDRLGDRVEVEVRVGRAGGDVEVAVGADVVDVLAGSGDGRGHACLPSLLRGTGPGGPGWSGARSGAEDGGGDAQARGGGGEAGLVLAVGDLAGDRAELRRD